MSLVPDNDNRRHDALDFISDGLKEIVEVQNDQGIWEEAIRENPEIAWFKGHIINRPFGRLALQLKNFQRLGFECNKYMSPNRAKDMKSSIMLIVDAYKRSIDAKSSEIYKDEHNTQSSLVHLLNKNKVEKQYTLKEDIKEGILDGLIKRKRSREMDED